MTKPGMNVEFKYNHNGLRTQKKVVENGVTTTYDYTLHGKLITHLTKSVVDSEGNEAVDHLHFFYDAQSKPTFVEYNGEMYRYIHNLQGDIVAIIDSVGTCVVEYKYDAWGKPISITGSMDSTLGAQNPFRYRGYVWDKESGFYYLRSRYYNVAECRFLNEDTIIYRGDTSLFNGIYCYCGNNPVNRSDFSGNRHEIYAGVPGGGLRGEITRTNRIVGNTLRSNGKTYKIIYGKNNGMKLGGDFPEFKYGWRTKSFFSWDKLLVEFGELNMDVSYGLLNVVKDCIISIEAQILLCESGSNHNYAKIFLVFGVNDSVEGTPENPWAYTNVHIKTEPVEVVAANSEGIYVLTNDGRSVFIEDYRSQLVNLIADVDIVLT